MPDEPDAPDAADAGEAAEAAEPAEPADPWPLLSGLSLPAAVVDPQGGIVYLNPSAEAFWGVRLADVVGTSARQVLQIGPRDGRPLDEWLQTVVRAGVDSGEPVPARTIAARGAAHLVELILLPDAVDGRHYAQMVLREPAFAPPRGVPLPPRDPVSGLPLLRDEGAMYQLWNQRGGVLILFDIDALREANVLYGAATGDDILAEAAQAIGAEAPPGALAARSRNDELVLLLKDAAPGSAEATAAAVIERLNTAMRAAAIAAPRLHYGVAAFGPTELARALREAHDAVYERRRALLRAMSGGRILLTREGRSEVQEPGGDAAATAPGAFASRFTADWEAHFAQIYARSRDQAREFVSFVAPAAGTAVIEVGAGAGRITFDGGLAERIGAGGQLLVTDASAAQVETARRRAAELGFGWVRFVCAPVEGLPVEPGTADLCLGAVFLHFTNPPEAIRAMARVVRPGGRVAVCAALDVDWPPSWIEILQPVYDALSAHGLAVEAFGSRRDVEDAFRSAGLTLDRAEESSEELAFPSADLAIGVWQQTRLVSLMLRRLPPETTGGIEDACMGRLREVWRRGSPADLTYEVHTLNIIGHR